MRFVGPRILAYGKLKVSPLPFHGCQCRYPFGRCIHSMYSMYPFWGCLRSETTYSSQQSRQHKGHVCSCIRSPTETVWKGTKHPVGSCQSEIQSWVKHLFNSKAAPFPREKETPPHPWGLLSANTALKWLRWKLGRAWQFWGAQEDRSE